MENLFQFLHVDKRNAKLQNLFAMVTAIKVEGGSSCESLVLNARTMGMGRELVAILRCTLRLSPEATLYILNCGDIHLKCKVG